MPRPPAQPAFTGPLRKTQRSVLIGVEAETSAPPPVLPVSVEAPGPSDGEIPGKAPASTAGEPVLEAASAVSDVASGPTPRRRAARPEADGSDELLSSVLAGRASNRTIPITRLEPELHGTLRMISSRTGVTIQNLVNGAVRGWLHENRATLVARGVLEP